MKEILILDADSIAYKAAAANEARTIKTRHKGTGIIEQWDNRTHFRKYLAEERHDSEEMYEIEDVQEPRHVSYGQSLVRNMIRSYTTKLQIPQYEIYISGTDNFRDSIPLPQAHETIRGGISGGKYKGKREDNIRPKQLKEIRQWMIDDFGAIVVNGMEVDDMSSIRAYEGWKAGDKIIQVTEDKDATQCSGWLYNPAKMSTPILVQGFGKIEKQGAKVKGYGRAFLYFQALYGDAVDCYHGADIWKAQDIPAGRQFGEMAALGLLKDAKTDREAVQIVYNQYKKWYPGTVDYVAWDGSLQSKNAVEIMQMYFDCAHMRRWHGDRIDVPALLAKLDIDL